MIWKPGSHWRRKKWGWVLLLYFNLCGLKMSKEKEESRECVTGEKREDKKTGQKRGVRGGQ